jgi:RNA polymerase sigma-70 factor (ECF subfamily)
MQRYGENSVEQLADLAARGDHEAFRRFVEHTHGPALRLALRIVRERAEAEDVVQDAYLRAWSGFSRLRDRAAARGWLLTIVRNVAVTAVEARRRKRHGPENASRGQPLEHVPSDRPAPDAVLVNRRLGDALGEVVDALEHKYRTLLLLRVVDGLSYDELADALRIPVGTVGTRLLRSRQLVAQGLKDRVDLHLAAASSDGG